MAAKGGPLAELAASVAISVDTVTRQQQEIKRSSEQVYALKKIGTLADSVGTFPGGNILCSHCEAVSHTAPHRKNACYLDPRKMTSRKEWEKNSWMKKAWRARMTNDGGGKN